MGGWVRRRASAARSAPAATGGWTRYQASDHSVATSQRTISVSYTNRMATTDKRFKVPRMEGATARSYARLRRSGNQPEQYRRQAAELTAGLPDGADVLEVAPGPGYLAIEIARLDRYQVTGL